MKRRLVRHANAVVTVVTAALMLSGVVPAAAQEAKSWKFEGALYAWLSGIDGTIGAGPAGGGQPITASFDDLAGYLDFAAAGHFEAKTDKVVLLTDINYAGLGAERDADVTGRPSQSTWTSSVDHRGRRRLPALPAVRCAAGRSLLRPGY
jgi:hypothetical protein